MNRIEKKEVIESLNDIFQSSAIVVIVHNLGVNVASFRELRRSLKAVGSSCLVTKNTLAKIALQNTDYSHIASKFSGPTAIAYSKDDVVGLSKVINDFCKDQKMEVVGGGMSSEDISAAKLKTLASLPSLDQLRGKLVALIATPATRIARILNTPGEQVARLLNAYARKN